MTSVVAINAGSSSIKFALFVADEASQLRAEARGKIESIGIEPHMLIQSADGKLLDERRWIGGKRLTHEALLNEALAWLEQHLKGEPSAIGHRVVHGGIRHTGPALLDAALLAELDALCALAPLHQPHNLAGIRAAMALRPHVPHVACFDTAFHQARSDVTTRLPLPRAFHDQGIRRYGFHGLSYEFIADALPRIAPGIAAGRVIAAHLGNGASLCALKAGRSVDTTMSFTALDGLMMGTRCGQIDPGVVLHLIRQLGMDPAAVEDMLYRHSGLLGVSGVSSDMRALVASPEPAAREAVDLFAWSAAKAAGAMTVSLEGLDGVVFTAGIGEHDAAMRARICERLAWLGLRLDDEANEDHRTCISAPDSKVTVLVVATDEERMIARHSLAIVSGTP
jgi:acetate kinase